MALWKEFGIQHCYTLETSIMGFINKERETVLFNEESFNEFGMQFGHALFEFFMIREQDKL